MTLFNGDCLEVMKSFESNSIAALVTDPPAGISFMGKEWDHHKGGRTEWVAWLTEVMREALRVLKPGAHGLVWALPRTSHWTATALEDAGFEVRDVVTHLFGSGFPKSMNVAIAIDKQAGAVKARGKGFNVAGQNVQLNQNKELRSDHPDYVPPSYATDDAKKWQGWGTALKPASEHWILVRKPLSEKTVSANVLKWGTGALNIDASRIGYGEAGPDRPFDQVVTTDAAHFGNSSADSVQKYKQQGRFPANLVLDEYAAALLDEQSGQLGKSSGGGMNRGGKNGVTLNRPERKDVVETVGFGDSGGASRFFYVAKASKRDKNAGLEGMPLQKKKIYSGGIPSAVNSDPRGMSGGGEREAQNHHPTVKSTTLMTYLIRMVTPPGGIVLDPFMGSGSTGVAARVAGFEFHGIEREKDYFDIASQRIAQTLQLA